eukprot:TRINITY_DN11170_c0_g1_i7.p1 TRINITY_DN11170_c0_g1~~TRINITY_DN11170_c0_g1_i7.p1  ORF type:complete len:197 (+),score=22.54 TRINITY_DN11170_c0_g1_i7:21-611(+)
MCAPCCNPKALAIVNAQLTLFMFAITMSTLPLTSYGAVAWYSASGSDWDDDDYADFVLGIGSILAGTAALGLIVTFLMRLANMARILTDSDQNDVVDSGCCKALLLIFDIVGSGLVWASASVWLFPHHPADASTTATQWFHYRSNTAFTADDGSASAHDGLNPIKLWHAHQHPELSNSSFGAEFGQCASAWLPCGP